MVPNFSFLDFVGAKDDGTVSDGDNWNYKTRRHHYFTECSYFSDIRVDFNISVIFV